MLVIRASQKRAFQSTRANSYHKSAQSYLLKALPEKTVELAKIQLEKKVQTEVQRAMAYGITIEWDVCRYVYFEFLYGPRFDHTCAWAKKHLVSENLSSTEKMDAIESFHLNYLKA